MIDFASRLAHIRSRIEKAAARSGRDPSGITLVAVSKTQPVETILEAYGAGHRVFGENYAQELAEKAAALSQLPDLTWHFIGHLQRNKARLVAPHARFVETVDSVELARALVARLPEGKTLEGFVQVNIAGEAQKSGMAPGEVAGLVDALRSIDRLRVCGLMTVPPIVEDPEHSRPYFVALRELGVSLGLPHLSMGMSHDFEVAVEEGATHVRVGTALFGKRG